MKKINILLVLPLFVSCNNSDKLLSSFEIEKGTEVMEKVEATQIEDISEIVTPIVTPVTFNGTLVIPPAKFATISMTMGGTIRQVNLLPGSYIRKGSVLAHLENPDFIEVQHTFLDSNAQLEYLEAEYKRQEKLSKEEVASQKKYQQSKAEYLSMKSRNQAAEAQLKLLGVEASSLLLSGIRPYIEIKAPIDGYISNVQVNLGKYLDAGEALCDLIDKSEAMVRLVAYEKDLKKLSLGDRIKFCVNGLDDEMFYATLVSIGQNVDDISRSLELYAKVDQKNNLFRPGMYVSAQIAE